MTLERGTQLWPGIAAIGKHMAQPGEAMPDRPQHVRRTVAVLNIGGVDHGEQQQAKGIGNYVALAALDLFAGVIPANPSTFSGFHALAVDHARRRAGLSALKFAGAGHQQMVDCLPQPSIAPSVEVTPDCRDRREILRQHSPLTTADRDVEDGVCHRT